MNEKQLLEKLIDKEDLNKDEATWMMNGFMNGNMTHSQMAAILTALRIKQETVTEIAACAAVMREKSTKIPITNDNLIDTCGTGGDASGSINISTAVALLLAGGGYKIAKHGNRSMSSKSGSADLLEALGVNLDITPEQVAQCINKANIGFLFAPALHSAMRFVGPVRKELGIRTVFNVLGPLTNPAGAKKQIIGLYSKELVSKIIRVLRELGTESAYVFSGLSGLDEVCIADDTQVAQLTPDGNINGFIFNPEEYGFKKVSIEDIKGGTPEENADITKKIFNGTIKDARQDVILINAGFAISASDLCSLQDGFDKARELINMGAGIKAIENLVKVSNSFS